MKKGFFVLFIILLLSLGVTFFIMTQNPLKSVDVPNLVAYHLTTEQVQDIQDNKVVELIIEEDSQKFIMYVSDWEEKDESLLTAEDLEYRVDKLAISYPDKGEAYNFLVKTELLD